MLVGWTAHINSAFWMSRAYCGQQEVYNSLQVEPVVLGGTQQNGSIRAPEKAPRLSVQYHRHYVWRKWRDPECINGVILDLKSDYNIIYLGSDTCLQMGVLFDELTVDGLKETVLMAPKVNNWLSWYTAMRTTFGWNTSSFSSHLW